MDKDFKKELDDLFDREELLSREVEVAADADCDLFCDSEWMLRLTAGTPSTIRVSRGKHVFVFKAAGGNKRTRTVEIGDNPNRIYIQGIKTPQAAPKIPTLMSDVPPRICPQKSCSAEERKDIDKGNGNLYLVLGNVLFFVAGIVLFIIAISSYQNRGDLMVVPTSFDPWGWIGFGLLCVSFCFSLICLVRDMAKSFSIATLALSLLVGGVCLYDSIEEDNKVCNPFIHSSHYNGGYYDNYSEHRTRNSVTFKWNTFTSTESIPFELPAKVYLYEGSQYPNFSVAQSGKRIPGSDDNLGAPIARLTSTPYYTKDVLTNELTILNLKPNSSYWVRFVRSGIYLPYGLFDLFEFYSEPNVVDYHFTTSN